VPAPNTIDVEAATARGIAVMNAPDGNTLAAAEHAISLLFALARHIPKADAGMKAGEWPKAGLTGFEVEGKRLGVIGLGRIGATVARKAVGVGMEVAAYDPFLPAAAASRLSLPMKSLDELLAWADIITLHIPRTKETTNIIGEAQMRLMKKGSYLINGRGAWSTRMRYRAARRGHLAGAALDTFVTEPGRRIRCQKQSKLILTRTGLPPASTANGDTILARQIIDFLKLRAGCESPPLTPKPRRVGPWMLMTALANMRLVPAERQIAYAGRTEAWIPRRWRLLVAALRLGVRSGHAGQPLA
jgi:D-3-phosphoglycerate dehydrogenase